MEDILPILFIILKRMFGMILPLLPCFFCLGVFGGSIMFFGFFTYQMFQFGSTMLFLNHQLSDMVQEFTPLSIHYSIKTTVDNFDNPILNCEMMDPIQFKFITPCPDFAKAWVNNFVYQDAVSNLLMSRLGKWKNAHLSGTVKIGHSYFYSIYQFNKTGFNESENMLIYNIASKSENDFKCSGHNLLGTFCNRQDIKTRIRLLEVILGTDFLNVTGLVGTDENERTIFELNYINGKFSDLSKLMENVVHFEILRDIMCKCQNKHFSRSITLTAEEKLKKCFEEHQVRLDFRPFLSPPSCFGGSTFDWK